MIKLDAEEMNGWILSLEVTVLNHTLWGLYIDHIFPVNTKILVFHVHSQIFSGILNVHFEDNFTG